MIGPRVSETCRRAADYRDGVSALRSRAFGLRVRVLLTSRPPRDPLWVWVLAWRTREGHAVSAPSSSYLPHLLGAGYPSAAMARVEATICAGRIVRSCRRGRAA